MKKTRTGKASIDAAKKLITSLVERYCMSLEAIAIAACELVDKEVERQNVLCMRKDGMSIKAIAKAMHISDKRVSAIIAGSRCKKR